MSSTNEGIARELADEQKQTSIAEFFEKNKQMLGFGSENRALVTAVKEGVDNSLDAAEEARILPEITVNIEKNEEFYTISIEDNGPGIPSSSVPSVFGKLLYGSRFHRQMQQRGQQGIGISAAVLYSQLTTGNPARVTSKTQESDKAYYVEIGIDTDNNEPQIQSEKKTTWNEKEHGVKIELDMVANMRARKRLHRYIRNTAVANPHAKIRLQEPKHDLIFDERPVDELPDKVEEIKPHPHGVELGTLLDMLNATDCRSLKSFFKKEFTRVGDKTAESIIEKFQDLKYGSYLQWIVTSEEVEKSDYINAVTESVNRKGKSETKRFADLIYQKISGSDNMVGYGGIKNAVEVSAETVTEETSKTFGSTVQQKAKEAVWSVLTQNVQQTVHETVNSVTVDRKPQDLLDIFSKKASKALLQQGARSITKQDLQNIIEESAELAGKEFDGNGSFGQTAKDKIFEGMWSNLETVDGDLPTVSKINDDRETARYLLEGMRDSNAMAPPKTCIAPISEEHILRGMKSRYNGDFFTASTRGAEVTSGKPFVVEAGIAFGGDIDPEGQIELERFANRVPLVYQQGACAITKQVKSIQWNNYYRAGDSLTQSSGSIPVGPMVLVVHVASTNVPFTSESKDAIANVPEMEKEIEMAIREVARDLKGHLTEERQRKQKERKQKTIGPLLSKMTDKIESVLDDSIENKNESQARILNNLYVRKTGEKTIRITNHGGKNYKVQIQIQTENGERSRERTVSKGESVSVSVPDKVISFNVINPDSARVTAAN